MICPTSFSLTNAALDFLHNQTSIGGKGEIRTHTGHRMKVLHNHYATLPYRNTLEVRGTEGTIPAIVYDQA